MASAPPRGYRCLSFGRVVYPAGKEPLGKELDLGHLWGMGLGGRKDYLQGEQAAQVDGQIEGVAGGLAKADLMIAHSALWIYRQAGARVVLRPLQSAVYKLGPAEQLGGYQGAADPAHKALHQVGAK